MKIALIQGEFLPEQKEDNLAKLLKLAKEAVDKEAEVLLFSEACLTDYVQNVDEYSEAVPSGPSSQVIKRFCEEHNVYISFGLLERENSKSFITQVFLGPNDYFYKYQKTWLHHVDVKKEKERYGDKYIERYRDEFATFNPGIGPEAFEIKGFSASCMICSDAKSQKCLETINSLHPKIVFYPNNRARWRDAEYWASIAKQTGSLLLITNKVGESWGRTCPGGTSVYSPKGELLLSANQDGKEEILYYEVT